MSLALREGEPTSWSGLMFFLFLYNWALIAWCLISTEQEQITGEKGWLLQCWLLKLILIKKKKKDFLFFFYINYWLVQLVHCKTSSHFCWSSICFFFCSFFSFLLWRCPSTPLLFSLNTCLVKYPFPWSFEIRIGTDTVSPLTKALLMPEELLAIELKWKQQQKIFFPFCWRFQSKTGEKLHQNNCPDDLTNQ